MANKRGRPSTYTPEIAAEICERIANGASLIAVCGIPGMPRCSTVFVWLSQQPEFAEMYARARESQADYYAAEIAEIADTPQDGVKVKRTQVGWQCPACQRAAKWLSNLWIHADGTMICEGVKKPDPVYEAEETVGDMIEHRKLRVDARKFLMAKLAPKRYGDRITHAGDEDAPLQTKVVIEVVDSPRQIAGAKQLEGGGE